MAEYKSAEEQLGGKQKKNIDPYFTKPSDDTYFGPAIKDATKNKKKDPYFNMDPEKKPTKQALDRLRG